MENVQGDLTVKTYTYKALESPPLIGSINHCWSIIHTFIALEWEAGNGGAKF
jgi:hypothetical protein